MNFFIEFAIVAVAAIFATTSAEETDFGYFIPKAFYTLDADGHKTERHPVSPHTAQYLHRLRRQVFSSSSSSSSSSVSSGNGGPIYFGTQNSVSHSPAGAVSFSSRFGDDGSIGSIGSGYVGSGYAGNSASASSAFSSNGGPVYFKTEQSVSHSPTSNINISSRFGGGPPQTVGKTVSTSGYIDGKGIVHANTYTKKTP